MKCIMQIECMEGCLDCVCECVDRFWCRHSANVLAAVILVAGVWLNTVMLALANERVPTNESVLPDLSFDFLPLNFHCLLYTEVFLALQYVWLLIGLVLHRDREIILRRLMFLVGIIFLTRMVTAPSTTLPCPANVTKCEDKLAANRTTLHLVQQVLLRSFQYVPLSLGFTIRSGHTLCGGYVFSGQTALIIIVYLFLNRYFFLNKQKYRVLWCLLAYVHFGLATAAVVCLLVSRQDYTVDVILGYYVTTQLFWSYHSLCLEKYMFQELLQRYDQSDGSRFTNHTDDDASGQSIRPTSITMRQNPRHTYTVREDPNFLSQVWWWSIFVYLEIIKKPDTRSVKDEKRARKKAARIV